MTQRDTYIRVMMSEKEKRELEEASRYIGETLSSFVRRVMLNASRNVNKAA